MTPRNVDTAPYKTSRPGPTFTQQVALGMAQGNVAGGAVALFVAVLTGSGLIAVIGVLAVNVGLLIWNEFGFRLRGSA